MMFAETRDEDALQQWVAAVKALRYKDFRCIARPLATVSVSAVRHMDDLRFEETESMKVFAEKLDSRGLGSWYKALMFS